MSKVSCTLFERGSNIRFKKRLYHFIFRRHVQKENEKYGKLVGKDLDELKIELGIPTEDFVNEKGNKILIYKTSKYGIPCERKFEIGEDGTVLSFSTSGCI